MIFACSISAGKLDINRHVFSRHLHTLPDGKYELTVKKQVKSRSVRQNRYMWGVVYKIIAEETGYSVEEIHQIFRNKYLSYENNGFNFTQSTSSLSTKEFEAYLEEIRRFAAMELNVVIPNPNEEWS